ncbi:MAG: hypothetical protein O2782_12810 [bacterium]|nr:hypothetical protein [bacterium]
MLKEVRRGRAVDVAAEAFSRHRRRLLGGIVGSAGVAGGAWAALTAWTGSLGVWGTVGLSLGLLSPPAWVPLAGGLVGGLAGLGAAGSAVTGALSLNRARARRRHLSAIVGLSREMAGAEGGEGERLLRGFLRFRGVSGEGSHKLLSTTGEQARRAAAGLSAEDRWDVARCIFPLVYQGDGVITDAGRRRFVRICESLGLPADAQRTISRDYRQHLDGQWSHLRRLVAGLNYFAEVMVFDLRELETVRDLLERLSRFDPRRRGDHLRADLLSRLGRDAGSWVASSPLEEASLVSAYALAQTALVNDTERRRLSDAFDQLVASSQDLSGDDARRLCSSRERVDRIYHDHLQGAAPDEGL